MGLITDIPETVQPTTILDCIITYNKGCSFLAIQISLSSTVKENFVRKPARLKVLHNVLKGVWSPPICTGPEWWKADKLKYNFPSGTANGSTSELSYKPQSDRDYGALSCRGTNPVGRQVEPCVFQIVPALCEWSVDPNHQILQAALPRAVLSPIQSKYDQTDLGLDRLDPVRIDRACGVKEQQTYTATYKLHGYQINTRPAPPRNCSLHADTNTTEGVNWLMVRCVAGYDGGLPQTFVLEALDPITGKTKFNSSVNETDGLATFKLDLAQLSAGSAEGATFNLLIYAKNLKGDSEKTLLENIAFNDAARRTDGKTSMGGITLGVVVAVALGAALALGGIAFAALCARRKRSQPNHKHPPGDMLELSDGCRRYVVAYTIKPSPESKTPEPQPDILNAPDGENQKLQHATSEADEWPSIKELRGDWSQTGAVFSAEDLALLDSAGRMQQLTPGSDMMPSSRQEDVINQNITNNFRPNFGVTNSPTLGSPNFVCPNGNVGSPFGSQTLALSGPTLSSSSLATSTLHRKGKGNGNVRRREHVLAENLPGPESCV
ncbi:jg11930 [Pararge aegeria aegeria]|uniref:Jg11930 protein n=1 Tax=Pararge aegeria aegeria TaxID=348720 RepID=A0A8S4SBG8_9NEOP|nr:jg11930 [Pararge aegeria aegeria]